MEQRSHTASPVSAEHSVQTAHGEFCADEIHRQLNRILGSAHFHDSLRLTRFLQFVVETMLAGDSKCIKAYTIAVEALGRDSSFDPQSDPIVRVEAGRLRQALARYYAGVGRDDALVIDLPRGTYVPSFNRRVAASAARQIDRKNRFHLDENSGPKSLADDMGSTQQCVRSVAALASSIHRFGRSVAECFRRAQAQHEKRASVAAVLHSTKRTQRQSRNLPQATADFDVGRTPALPPISAATRLRANARIFRIGFHVVAVLAILELAFDIDHPWHGGQHTGSSFKLTAASEVTASRPPQGEAAPILYVEPLTATGEPTPAAIPPSMIRDRLIDALARFDDITIVSSAPQSASARVAAASESEPAPPSYYRLATAVQYDADDTMTMIVRLIDTAEGTVIWSKTYKRNGKPDAKRDNGLIVGDVAQSLLQPFGVIEARERVKRAGADNLHDTYRCILDANAYLHNFDPSQYSSVENCLAHATAEKPPAVSVFVALARLYLRDYRFGTVGQPGDRAMLDRAYRMAARGIDIKPNSALAQYALQDVLLAEGDIPGAKAAGETSLRLNPYDGEVVFGHASLLILLGQIDEGIALLRRNSAQVPTTWIGYHLLLALGSYLNGDLKTAALESGQIASPFLPTGLVLDALVANKTGDRLRAHQDIAMLYQAYPSWRKNFRANIALLLPDAAMADRIAADFAAAAAGV